MNLEVMTQEELKRYTIPVKYNGMTISGDMVDYPKNNPCHSNMYRYGMF